MVVFNYDGKNPGSLNQLILQRELVFLGVTHRNKIQLIETGTILCHTPTVCPHYVAQ